MKNAISFLLLVCSFILHSQEWQQITLVDEFGDPTGNTITGFDTQGKMNNSATTDADALLRVTYKPQEYFEFKIFEYGNNPATFLCETIGISFKTEGGTIYREILLRNQEIRSGYVTMNIENNYKYGGTYFRIPAPTEKQIKRLSKKGKTHLYTLLSAYKGELKTAISCGNSRYRFTVKGIATPKE